MTNVVMLVRDRYRLTKQAIESLFVHTPYNQFNLTVVDDESEDFRVQMLLLEETRAALVRIGHSQHVLSQAKNLGVYWSEQRFGRGEYLCICDNDVYFMEGWLDRMIQVVQASELSGFKLWGGQAHPFHQPFHQVSYERPGYTEHNCLAGTHWFMRWPTWDDYGPFDRTTAPGVCQSEDYAFTERIRRNGGRIGVTVPHCVLDTGITQTDGKPSPGAEEKMKRRVAGVLYE